MCRKINLKRTGEVKNARIIDRKLRTSRIAANISALLEYYDSSLYVFMAPLLTQILLPHVGKIYALTLAFSVPIVGLIARPLGAMFFGRMGDRFGRKRALSITVYGMSATMLAMGMLPTYQSIGIAAPIALVALRFAQTFFLAGEYNGSAILLLESSQISQGPVRSAIYSAFVSVGILAASIVSTFAIYMTKHGYQHFWRLPYLIGFALGVTAFALRSRLEESPEFSPRNTGNALEALRKNWPTMLQCAVVSLYTSISYKLVTTLMNALLPLATSVTQVMAMNISSLCIVLAIVFYPIFGWIAARTGSVKLMVFSGITLAAFGCPMMLAINNKASVAMIVALKIVLSLLSVCFSAPFHHWIQHKFAASDRYFCVSLSYAAGASIGTAIAPAALWLLDRFHSLLPVGIMIATFSTLAVASLLMESDGPRHRSLRPPQNRT